MNLKNVSLKLLSVVMTLVLLLSICAPTISALTPHDHDHDHEEALLDAIVDIIGVVNSADIEASLNELFAMIAELGEEYAPEAWDKIVASGILDDVSDSAKAIQDEAASQMTEIEQTVKAELEKQIKILKDEINAQRAALEEAIEKAAQEMIDELRVWSRSWKRLSKSSRLPRLSWKSCRRRSRMPTSILRRHWLI